MILNEMSLISTCGGSFTQMLLTMASRVKSSSLLCVNSSVNQNKLTIINIILIFELDPLVFERFGRKNS
jgi:hypothetical protein